MLRAAKPIMLTLRSWTARAEAKVLKSQRSDVEEALRSGAQEHSVMARTAPFGEKS
jgi:hypothetical protein